MRRQAKPYAGFVPWMVLGLLVLALAGVLVVQSQYDPARWGWGTAPVAATVDQGGGSGPLADLQVPGVSPLGASESYDPETLSDKIDGKAELYLAAGFQRLDTRRLARDGHPDQWLEVFRYQMKDPQAAFSVLSGQRREGGVAWEGATGYLSGASLFAQAGPLYLEIIPSGTQPELAQAAQDVARQILAQADPATEQAAAQTRPGDRLPVEGQKEGSLMLLATDAFGLAGLDQVWLAEYGDGLTAWISRRPDPAAARALVDQYLEFMNMLGAQPKEALEAPAGSRVRELYGTVEVVMSRGPYAAGVRGSQDLKTSLDLSRRLYGALEDKK